MIELYSINYYNMDPFIYLALLITVVGFIAFITSKSKIKWVYIIPLFLMGFVGIGSAILHYNSVNALRNGDYRVIQGAVENFQPSSSNVKRNESFRVNGITFKYSNHEIRSGLRSSLEKKGLKDGVYVRVYYRNKSILKLEMRK